MLDEQQLIALINHLLEPKLLEFFSLKMLEFQKEKTTNYLKNSKLNAIHFSGDQQIRPRQIEKPYKIRDTGSQNLKIDHVFKGSFGVKKDMSQQRRSFRDTPIFSKYNSMPSSSQSSAFSTKKLKKVHVDLKSIYTENPAATFEFNVPKDPLDVEQRKYDIIEQSNDCLKIKRIDNSGIKLARSEFIGISDPLTIMVQIDQFLVR